MHLVSPDGGSTRISINMAMGEKIIAVIGIFEDQEEINRKTRAKFSDVCEKQFSHFRVNTGRLMKYVQESGGMPTG